MLLQFSVTNHRSIHNKAVISLAATSDTTFSGCLLCPDEKKHILPVVAIYGANAAGKSNILHAFKLMQSMIAGGNAKPLKDERLPQEPFAFTDTEEPTSFEAIYYYNGIKYAYGFSFTKKAIIEEYLYHWRNGREGLVFQRIGSEYIFRERIGEQSILAGRTPENRLFLVTSNEWNNSETQDAYLWFTRNLTTLPDNSDSFESTLSELGKGAVYKSRILKELLVADLGIVDIKNVGTEDSPLLITTHKTVDNTGKESFYELRMNQESQGTKRFFSRIGSWLTALENGGTLVVDEIESSMHPLLTKHLIESMQDSSINRNRAQLIFTTHDVGLLDQRLLRRDQIWFTERNNETAETEVYALTDFSPRKDENIQKGYLQGRYGAVPFISRGTSIWDE